MEAFNKQTLIDFRGFTCTAEVRYIYCTLKCFVPPHRNQKADERWSFSAIVDELLDIVDEVPNSKCVEVGEVVIAAEF